MQHRSVQECYLCFVSHYRKFYCPTCFCHLILSGSCNGSWSLCQQPLGGNSGQAWGVWQVRCLQEVPKHLQSSQSTKIRLLWFNFLKKVVSENAKTYSPLLLFTLFLLSCPQERNDVEVEKVKSTLILCYGQVALNAPPEKILNRIDQDILRSISKHFNTKVIIIISYHHCAVNDDFV